MTFKALAAAAVFALATLASPAAHAEEDARMGLARELMALMRIESLLGDFFTTMSPMIADGMGRDLQLSPVETARLSEIVGEELRAATPRISEQMARVYAGRMSEAQLRETVTFLSSGSGAAFLQTQVDAQSELERIGATAGMAAGLQAMLRLQQERDGGE